jgi:hypothetical protein
LDDAKIVLEEFMGLTAKQLQENDDKIIPIKLKPIVNIYFISNIQLEIESIDKKINNNLNFNNQNFFFPSN